MSYDIDEFPSLNGHVTGAIKHVHDSLHRYITDELALAHFKRVLSGAMEANDQAFGIVQAHRYPTIAEDLLRIHCGKNGEVACHNTLAI
jgi:hypothetical protein